MISGTGQINSDRTASCFIVPWPQARCDLRSDTEHSKHGEAALSAPIDRRPCPNPTPQRKGHGGDERGELRLAPGSPAHPHRLHAKTGSASVRTDGSQLRSRGCAFDVSAAYVTYDLGARPGTAIRLPATCCLPTYQCWERNDSVADMRWLSPHNNHTPSP